MKEKDYEQASLFQAPTKSGNAAKNDFRKIFEQLSWNQAYYTTFDDFLDFALWQLDVQETRDVEVAERLEKRYKPEDGTKFAQMFHDWTIASDNEGEGFYDVLGDLYMELLSKSRAGQFFTPQPLCDMMAQLNIGPNLKDGETVADNAGCGSGRMILAAAKINRNAKFFGTDMDLTCCKMTVLNMIINTLEGEVTWADALRMKHYGSWIIRKRKVEGKWLPCFIRTGPEENFTGTVTSKYYPYGIELSPPQKRLPDDFAQKLLAAMRELETPLALPSPKQQFFSMQDQYHAYIAQMK